MEFSKKIKKSILLICYKWKQVLTVGLVLFSVAAMGFCLFKISYALLNKTLPNNTASKPDFQNQGFKLQNKNSSQSKNFFRLRLDDFIATSEQTNLLEGNKYFIINQLGEHEHIQCNLGEFQLYKKQSDSFLFKIITRFEGKRFKHYSTVLQKPIKYLVLEANQVGPTLPSCKNWVYVANEYRTHQKDIFDSTLQLRQKQKNCTPMPFQIVAAQSFNPSVVYFKYDSLHARLLMCLKKQGTAIIQTLDLGSPQFTTVQLQLTR